MDIDELERLASAASPGPWEACGDDRGGCKCGQVWSKIADHPVAVVERGEWGDTYPAIRLTSDGLHGTQAEAYLERIPYGEIPEGKSQANMLFIAAANPETIKELVARIRQLTVNAKPLTQSTAGASEPPGEEGTP